MKAPRVHAIATAMVLLAVGATMVIYPVNCDDHWWHLATGRLVLETGAIPRTDPFSFTYGGFPWVNWEWLAGVLMMKAWSLAGPKGLVALRLIAVLSTAGIVFVHARRRTKRRDDATWAIAFALLGAGLIAMLGRVADRPHVLAWPLVAATHFAAWWSFEKASWRAVIGGAIAVAVWSQIHPSWVLGVVLFVVAAFDTREVDMPRALRAAPLLVALPAALLRNPLAYAAKVVELAGTDNLQEWRPLTTYLHWTNAPPIAFLLLGVAWAASHAPRPRRRGQVHELLLLGVLGASFVFVRFTSLFAILVVPTLLPALRKRLGDAPSARTARLVSGLVAAMLVGVSLQTREVRHRPFEATLDARANPVAVAAFMAEHDLRGNVWSNRLNAAAYLVFERHPHVRDYIDGRIPQLFPPEHNQRHVLQQREMQAFAHLLAEGKVEHVVLLEMMTRESAQACALLAQHPRFVLAYFDDHTMLWSRRDKLTPKTPAPYALLVPPLIGDRWFKRAAEPERFAKIEGELGRLLRERPGSQVGRTLAQTLAAQRHLSDAQRAAVRKLISPP